MEKISSTMEKLLKKYKVTLEEYRKIRKSAKAAMKATKKAKHQAALLGRKSKTSTKTKK